MGITELQLQITNTTTTVWRHLRLLTNKQTKNMARTTSLTDAAGLRYVQF